MVDITRKDARANQKIALKAWLLHFVFMLLRHGNMMISSASFDCDNMEEMEDMMMKEEYDEEYEKQYEEGFRRGYLQAKALSAAALSKNKNLSIDSAMWAVGVSVDDFEECRKIIDTLKK